MELVKFVHHYEKKIEEMRLTELEDDYRCKIGMRRSKVHSTILRSVVKVYTNKLFQLFEVEFYGCMGVRLKEVSNKDQCYGYEATEDGGKGVHKIEYNSTSLNISCSCRSFHTHGILCRHALKVFDTNNITSLPTQYILKRWTKEANKGIVNSLDVCGGSGEASNNLKAARVLRLSELMHEENNVYDIASLTSSGTKIVKDLLVEAMKRLEKDKDTLYMLENMNKVHMTETSDNNSGNEPGVLNPPNAKTKWMKNTIIKDGIERNKKKKRTPEAQQRPLKYDNIETPRNVSTVNPQYGRNQPLFNQRPKELESQLIIDSKAHNHVVRLNQQFGGPHTQFMHQFGVSNAPFCNQGTMTWSTENPKFGFSYGQMPFSTQNLTYSTTCSSLAPTLNSAANHTNKHH